MKVDFVKVSPSKNMTVLITNYIAPVDYSNIARRIMDYEYVHAEQVGFITGPKGEQALLRLEMSGGEFCGNGLLSAAAYCRFKGYTAEREFLLETSGSDKALLCFVEAKTPYLFEAKAEMPAHLSITDMKVQINGATVTGSLVKMDGIAHFVTSQWLEKEDFMPIMKQLASMTVDMAIGIIPYRQLQGYDYEIQPFVYVRETGSEFFEQACGSGSLALGITLSTVKMNRIINVHQPGGIIKVETGKKTYISTSVRFTCEGSCEME